MDNKIQMVDLLSQYDAIQQQIDDAVLSVVKGGMYINGPEVLNFSNALSSYLGGAEVITCANGTDALQIAMMALDLQQGDEIIVPSFTYVATAEVIGLLRLVPVMVDVDPATFTITADIIEKAITSRTRAVVPVHLFGQCADMGPILALAKSRNIYVIEDAAQALGGGYYFKNGTYAPTGTMGQIGCTSFFPSKNLGCFGDGGALFTKDKTLAGKIKMIANHGQEKKYIHSCIGVNSRLDTIQAAVLNTKLPFLDIYTERRIRAADIYDRQLSGIVEITTPFRQESCHHVFHQYTILVNDGRRDELKERLSEAGIPSMIYYPLPLNKQKAFASIGVIKDALHVSERLANSVLSLPMHTELTSGEQEFIASVIRNFFKK